jgi:hypothetical protein
MNKTKTPNKYKYRIYTSDYRIKFAGTDSPSFLTLELARSLVDYSKDEKIYEYDLEYQSRLWEVF